MKYNNILSKMSHKLEKADVFKEKSERRKQLSSLEERGIQVPDWGWEETETEVEGWPEDVFEEGSRFEKRDQL